MIKTKIAVLVSIIVQVSSCICSFGAYHPKGTYTSKSDDLMRYLTDQCLQEFHDVGELHNAVKIKQLNGNRINLLRALVRNRYFLKDDSLEGYVNQVMSRIVSANKLNQHPRKVLVARLPGVNAYCAGKGIYIVTIGLLGRLSTEDELAFILAHELAHDQMQHVRQTILERATGDIDKQAKENSQKLEHGKLTPEDIMVTREMLYDHFGESRQNEMLADSRGIRYMLEAGYNTKSALVALKILDNPTRPLHTSAVEIFGQLDAEEFPFDAAWLKPRLSIYNRTGTGTHIISSDSMRSHPDIEIRLAMLKGQNFIGEGNMFIKNQVQVTARYETVEAALIQRNYDVCLFYSLELLTEYPGDPYLVSRAGKVLVDLYEEISGSSLGTRSTISRYTSGFSDELVLVNNMLWNIRLDELGQMAYYFVSSPANFSVDDANHYYLIYKLCDLSRKCDQDGEVDRAYKSKFGHSIRSCVFH